MHFDMFPSLLPWKFSPICLSSLGLFLLLLPCIPLRAQGFELWSSGDETESIWHLQRAQTGGWLGCGLWGGSQAYDCWVWRVDDAGTPLWSYVHEREGEEILVGALEMPNGDWVVVGRSRDWSTSFEPYQLFLLRLDANGTLIEEHVWPSDLSVTPTNAVLDASNNNILITGWKESASVENEGFLLVLDAELEALEEETFGLGDTRMTNIMPGAEGNFYLSGFDAAEDAVSFVLYTVDASYSLMDSTSLSFAWSPTLSSHGAWMDVEHVFFAVSDKDENNDWRAGVIRYSHDLSGGEWLPFEQTSENISVGGHRNSSTNSQTVVGYGTHPETGDLGIWTRQVSNSFAALEEPTWLTLEHPLAVLRCVHFSQSELGLGGRLNESGNNQGFIKIMDSPASIDAPSAVFPSITVYPNPTSAFVHFKPTPGTTLKDYVWHDAIGNDVTSYVRPTGTWDADISDLPPGNYFVTSASGHTLKASTTVVKVK